MNRSRLWRWAGSLLVALVPTIAAPWVSAVMTGTHLNGVPGIVRFWNGVIHHTFNFELWQAVVFLVIVVALAFAFNEYRKHHAKMGLSIVVLSNPTPRWSIGAVATTPAMYVHFRAQFAHSGIHTLRLVKVYLKGTEVVASFPELYVTGPNDQPVDVNCGVRPILAKGRQTFTRRAVLVDQFGNKHQTKPIRFHPSPNPIPHALNAMGCHFCGRPVAMEDLAESASLFAHRSCVR